ncbi:hypothetical protein [Paraburkholderia sp. BL27I4N3]|uniref:hypothetical protein n=1 Tax=Paraburkholderia sp. BL27I4N3 TaxID=1938805 RepID=UPI0011C036E0|nr:hypothetical protein [Paraburkholderia sp. BL27I4N3]
MDDYQRDAVTEAALIVESDVAKGASPPPSIVVVTGSIINRSTSLSDDERPTRAVINMVRTHA